MSPVIDLARRVRAMSKTGRPEPLKVAFRERRSRPGRRRARRLFDAPHRARRARSRVQRRRQPRTAHAARGDREHHGTVAGIARSHGQARASACAASSARCASRPSSRMHCCCSRAASARHRPTARRPTSRASSSRSSTCSARIWATSRCRCASRSKSRSRPRRLRRSCRSRSAISIGNAFKYTQHGEVVVTVGHGRVSVEDTGPGIAPEDAEKLFERGVRGTSAGKGAGLGLAIVRRLCELYGWRVSLAPRPQGGAVATLEFGRSTYLS